MNKFKVGDKVKTVLGSQVLTIKEIKDDHYRVEENVYGWRDEHLVEVEEQFKVGDIVYNGDNERPLIILRKAWVVCYQDKMVYEHFVDERWLSKTRTLKEITEKELADMGYVIKR